MKILKSALIGILVLVLDFSLCLDFAHGIEVAKAIDFTNLLKNGYQIKLELYTHRCFDCGDGFIFIFSDKMVKHYKIKRILNQNRKEIEEIKVKLPTYILSDNDIHEMQKLLDYYQSEQKVENPPFDRIKISIMKEGKVIRDEEYLEESAYNNDRKKLLDLLKQTWQKANEQP